MEKQAEAETQAQPAEQRILSGYRLTCGLFGLMFGTSGVVIGYQDKSAFRYFFAFLSLIAGAIFTAWALVDAFRSLGSKLDAIQRYLETQPQVLVTIDESQDIAHPAIPGSVQISKVQKVEIIPAQAPKAEDGKD